jgi:hypothetical protein
VRRKHDRAAGWDWVQPSTNTALRLEIVDDELLWTTSAT